MKWNPIFPAIALSLPLLLACGGSGRKAVGPPTEFKVTERAYRDLELSWKPPAEPIDIYELQGKFGTNDWGLTERVPNYCTNWRYGVTADEFTNIVYRARAWKGDTPSPWSNESAVRVGLAPADRIIPYPEAGGLRVSWGNPSRFADTLLVERGTSPSATTPPATWTPVPNLPYSPEARISFLDPEIVEGLFHHYRVTYSKGAERAVALAAPALVTLAGPASIQATATGGTVHLSWRNRSTAATGIEIRRSIGKDPARESALVTLGTLAPTATSYDDVDLLPGYYTYSVRVTSPGASAAEGLPCLAQVLPAGGVWPFTDALVTLPHLEARTRAQDGTWWLAGRTGSALVVERGTASGWTPVSFPPGSGYPALQLFLDGQERPHLIHAAEAPANLHHFTILHTWLGDAGWTTETIGNWKFSPFPAQPLAVVLDTAGSPHLALYTVDASGNASLEYAFKDASGNWVVEKVADPVPATTRICDRFFLRLGPGGTPHLILGAQDRAAVLRRTGEDPWETILPWDHEQLGTVAAAEFTGAGHLRLLRHRTVTLPQQRVTEFFSMDFQDGAWTSGKALATVPDLVSASSLVASRNGERFAFLPTNTELLLYGPEGITRFQVCALHLDFEGDGDGRLKFLVPVSSQYDYTMAPVNYSDTYRCYLEKP